jgi:hypothetical protein
MLVDETSFPIEQVKGDLVVLDVLEEHVCESSVLTLRMFVNDVFFSKQSIAESG